jgi:holin-like protein
VPTSAVPFRKAAVALRRRLHASRLVQIGLVGLFWAAGEGLVRLFGLPLPGGVVGMLIVLGLFASGRIRLVSMRRGAEWFLAEMLLFFIPVVLAVLDHGELWGLVGLKIFGVILVGTLAVMAVTALTVDLCLRLQARAAR